MGHISVPYLTDPLTDAAHVGSNASSVKRWNTYYGAGTTSAFCAPQLSSCKPNSPQVLQYCDFWVGIIECDLGAIQVEPQSVVKVGSDLVELTQRICRCSWRGCFLDESRCHGCVPLKLQVTRCENNDQGEGREGFQKSTSWAKAKVSIRLLDTAPKRIVENAAVQPQTALSLDPLEIIS